MVKEQNSFASTEASSSQNVSMGMSTVSSTFRSQPARRRPPRRSYGRGRACVAYQRARAVPNWHVPTARSRRDLERYRARTNTWEK